MKIRPEASHDGEPPQQGVPSQQAMPSVDRVPVDVALIHGVAKDGRSLKILRQRDDTVESGIVRPLEEGKPVQGEVVRLTPRKELPLLCDVEVQYTPSEAAPETEALPRARQNTSARRGPAQVATDDYRKNWDVIYKRRPKSGALN